MRRKLAATDTQRNDNPQLDQALREIAAACDLIMRRAHRAADQCRHPRAGGYVLTIGGHHTDTEPSHERAFDALDALRNALRNVVETCS